MNGNYSKRKECLIMEVCGRRFLEPLGAALAAKAIKDKELREFIIN